MIEQRALPVPAAHGRTDAVGVIARLACATAGGLAFGVLTLGLQGHLHGNWGVLGNSGAVWTVVAVVLAGVLGTSRPVSVAAGVLALVGEVGGYYWLAAPWHGVAVATSEQVLWTTAALVIGPVAGLAGCSIARGSVIARAYASLSVAGLVAGEGLQLTHEVTAYPTAGRVEIAIGVALALLTVVVSHAPLRHRVGALVLGAVVGGAVLILYTAPLLVL